MEKAQRVQADISKIAKVYSGRTGCMCGCKGKYSYNEGTPRQSWQGEVNVRSVKIIANKIMNHPNRVEENGTVLVEENGRTMCLWYR